VTHPLKDVCSIESGSAHAYSNKICGWSWWILDFLDFKSFNATVPDNSYGFHDRMVKRAHLNVNRSFTIRV
jgi:hypothetical protein